jgi:hypothetical protein
MPRSLLGYSKSDNTTLLNIEIGDLSISTKLYFLEYNFTA